MTKQNLFRSLGVAVATALLFGSCAPKHTDGLVAASNLKKLQIDEKNLDRIDSLIGSALINNWAVGATALVAKDGQVIYDKGLGFRNRESKGLIRPTDLFRIASMTKPIVSVAAMMLVEQGKLKLDDEVSKYIPSFKNMQVLKSYNPEDSSYTTVPANAKITVKNLLTHTSGIGYGFADKTLKAIYEQNGIPDLANARDITIDSVTKILGTLPLGVQPNSRFYYGLNTDVLGRVIEVASEQALDSFLYQNILRPLEMNDTHFFLPAHKSNRLVAMYSETKEGRLVRTPIVQENYNINYPITGARKYLSGGSGLVSSVEDYARFLQMILNKGTYKGKRILTEASVAEMTKNQIGELNVGENKFGYGFEITTEAGAKNGASVGKASWGGIFKTTFWVDPQRNSLAVLMTQLYPGYSTPEFFSKFEKLVNETLDRAPVKKK